MKKYKVIALCGKSASGKSTTLKRLAQQYPKRVNAIISHTTRPSRENEIDGEDYFFVTDKEFESMIDNDEMLENTSFNGWYYGTSINSLVSGKVNIGVFNPEGVIKLSRNKNIELEVYYIYASDKDRLYRQLSREENPDVHEIVRRFLTDETDFKRLDEIPHRQILNDSMLSLSLLPTMILMQSKFF